MKGKSTKLSTFIFATTIATLLTMIVIVFVGITILSIFNIELQKVIQFLNSSSQRVRILLLLMLLSGFACAAIMNFIIMKRQLRPYALLKDGMKNLSKGDFGIKIETKGVNSREFYELLVQFNTLSAELNNTELFRKDFINNFSHEFKTPITSIKGFAKVLQNGELTDEEISEYLSIIINESTRLSRLSQNILTLCKIENQGIITNEENYELSEQIRLAILSLENEWAKKNLCFDLDIDDFSFYGNKDILNHVWVNLIDNAIKFSPQNSDISISLKEKNEGVFFTINDYGVGMDEETMNNIFTKFYQGDKSHSGRGNGIGLSIVKSVVDFYKGEISVESVPNKGTTFCILFPTE